MATAALIYIRKLFLSYMLKIKFHIQFTHIKILDQHAYTKNISKRLENTNINMYATVLKKQSMGINCHKE